MNREEFMKELEYLLQDIPDEEKSDAIEYYRDYLEEAGPDHEQEVLREFGSPERIASLIRSDLSGHLENGGEFTENGYEDPRFRDPNYQVAKRYDLPEGQDRRRGERKAEQSSSKMEYKAKEEKPWGNKILKGILICILAIIALPILLGVGGGMLGLVASFLCLLLGILLLAAGVTLAMLAAGVVLGVYGIIHIAISTVNGLLLIGIGLICFGIGWLCMAASIAFYGKFLPWVTGGMVDFINRIINGGRRQRKA